MKETLAKFGKLDYLINNGGGQFISPFGQINTKGWNAVVDTNLNGTYYCLREGIFFVLAAKFNSHLVFVKASIYLSKDY